jgi:hypothetical protein
MPPPNDLSRSLVAMDHNSTIVAVVELSQSSWLVGGVLPGTERALRPAPMRSFIWDLTIFPASRENTGNFGYFACWEQPNGAEYRKDNNALRENSRRPRTGKCRVSSGN